MHGNDADAMQEQVELVALERLLWTGGPEAYEQHLAPEALMVFPAPVGVLDRGATVDTIRAADRWQRVSLDDVRTSRLSANVVALVYRATANRGDQDEPYRAAVASTYRRAGQGWELVLHQQSPAAG